MKRLLCLSAAALCCSAGFSQVSFNNVVETGIIMPLNGSSGSITRNGNGIHIGNHLDLSVGNGCFNWGFGAYIGHASSLETDSRYKEAGIALARKFQLAPSQLSFSSTPFQSTQFLLGPVAGVGSGNFNMRLWAKAGFGINQAGTYAVTYREGNAEQRVFTTGSGENKNGLAYDMGAGFSYLLTRQLGFQVSASYNSTKTDMVNYSVEREKGLTPTYESAKNAFVKASVGLVFHLSNNAASPRDVASGMATGRRMHKPMVIRKDIEAREAGSGMATGRRMHKPFVIRIDSDGDQQVYENREAGSGMATGRRMHKPFVVRIDADDEMQNREAGSGMATGRRQYQPLIIRIDAEEGAQFRVDGSPLYEHDGGAGVNPLSGDSTGAKVTTPRDAASGMATGKRMHKPMVITKELGRVIVTGKDNDHIYITLESEVSDNPLYEEKGAQGNNPLYEGNSNAGTNPLAERMVKPGADKSINEKGIKRTIDDPAAKSINEKGIKRTENIDAGDATIDLIITQNGQEYRVKVKYPATRRRVEVLKSN